MIWTSNCTTSEFIRTKLLYVINSGSVEPTSAVVGRYSIEVLVHFNMAKSSWVTNDLEGKMKYAATQRATKRLSKCLIKWSISFGALLTIFFCSGGKFHRSGSEGDMWLVDAFVQHGQHVTAGPLRGKVAEKLFL